MAPTILAMLAVMCLVWSAFVGLGGCLGVYRDIGPRLDSIMFNVFGVLQIAGYLLAAAALAIATLRG